MALSLVAAGKTDRGLKRSHNEDSLSVCPELNIFVVADGMGGHNAGEVASRSAITSILDFLRLCKSDSESTWPFGIEAERSFSENKLLTAIRLANRDLCVLSLERREYTGMGTTIVSALFDLQDQTVSLAHVGDSRCYRLRNGAYEQVTLDHSWVSEQVQKKILTPEEARTHRWKNVITRALGNKLDVEIDIQSHELLEGDLYLLCSDGLCGLVEDSEMHEIIRSTPDLDEACEKMVAAANDKGGHDNISVIIVKVVGDTAGVNDSLAIEEQGPSTAPMEPVKSDTSA